MRVFARVVERRSFTLAAEDLGLPRSTVTDAVKQLEARLGVRLLERTTRHVSSTLDGEAYYQRCLAILADIEDAESAFTAATPKGLLRNVHGTLARHFVLPNLPAFLAAYPDMEIYMSEGDRLVDLIREGIDCVLRVGTPQNSDLIVRHVATLGEATLASPAYLERFGTPAHPNMLAEGHRMVGFRSSVTGALLPLEFTIGGQVRNLVLPATVSVNAAESYFAAAKLGLGLIQISALPCRLCAEDRRTRAGPGRFSADVQFRVRALSAQPADVAPGAGLYKLAGKYLRPGGLDFMRFDAVALP